MSLDAFEIVSNNRRRAFLIILQQLGGKACLREIVRRIAESEKGAGYNRKLEKSIHVSLLQTHLPKMQNAGLIFYDEQTGVVFLQEFPEDIKYYLEFVGKGDIAWSAYYLTLSSVGFVVSALTMQVIAITVTSCFLITSIVHVSMNVKQVNESLTRLNRELTKRKLSLKWK